jgi:hypothetical protein
MTRAIRTLAVLVLNCGIGLWATPSAADAASPAAGAVCKEDVVCIDTTTVHTWPLDRWSTVRRAPSNTATATAK